MNRPLTLYYRAGCHLCEEMLAELRALHGADFPVRLVDVDGDADLRARYGERVPVLMGGEHMLGSGRLDRVQLEEYLSGA